MKKGECKTCPKADPSPVSTSPEEQAQTAPASGPLWKVEVTAEKVTLGSLTCYRGALINIPESTANSIDAAGHGKKISPIY